MKHRHGLRTAHIVFNSDRDGNHELYVMRRDVANLTRLTNDDIDDGYSVWAQ